MAQSTTTIESVWAEKGNLPLAPVILDSNGGLDVEHFNYPNLTTSELNAVDNATEGDVYFDTDRGQFVRFTGAASYSVITSRTYVPTLDTTQGAALTLPETRLFESGVFAASPDVFSPTDLLVIYSGKNPAATTPVFYLYHSGEQGSAGWYNASDINGGIISSSVFTSNTLMQLQLSGVKTPIVTGNYIINTITPVVLSSAILKAGSTYDFKFRVGCVDLLGSNAAIKVDYTGVLESRGLLAFKVNNQANSLGLVDLAINSPEMPTKVVLNTSAFTGVAGPTFTSWLVEGQVTPSSAGTLTISIVQNTASVEPLYYSMPTESITLLSD